MKLTKKKAKKICLEVWEYLRDHPEIDDKRRLPQSLIKEIILLLCWCPLCEYHNGECAKCILVRCSHFGDIYKKWEYAETKKTRKKYASRIVEKVKAWEV